MYTINPDKVTKMIQTIADRHKGEMWSLMLDWETRQVSNPRYEGKIELLAPLLLIDFK